MIIPGSRIITPITRYNNENKSCICMNTRYFVSSRHHAYNIIRTFFILFCFWCPWAKALGINNVGRSDPTAFLLLLLAVVVCNNGGVPTSPSQSCFDLILPPSLYYTRTTPACDTLPDVTAQGRVLACYFCLRC